MSTLVAMTSTVGALTSGNTFRVRSKTAELLVKAAQATKSPVRKIVVANPHLYEGK